MTMPATPQLLFTLWLAVPLAVVLIFGVRNLLAGRGPLLLYCVIGGAIASIYEAIVNVLGTMIYAEDGIWTAYMTFDRKIPLLIPLAYAWFMGGQGYLCYRKFERGISTAGIFGLWAIFCVVDAVIETPGILTNVYRYYGAQPLNFWGFPWWYAWANSLVPVIAGAAIFRLLPHLRTGWHRLAVIALIPMSEGVGYAAVAWPVWSTLNTSLGYGATYIAAAAMLVLTLFVLWMVSLVVRSATSPHALPAPVPADI
jgi:hypothetical protein